MQIGAVFPQTEIGSDPVVIRDWAQAAESLGYSHIFVYDHVLGAVHADREPPITGPYDEETPFHEPFVLLGYLSAQTERVGLATGVLILPQRQTALVAKQAAEVDILSGGRLRLGVGNGWNHIEYEALGQDFGTRGRRQEEQVQLLRRLWTEPVVDFHGKWDTVDRAGIRPLPGRDIPIWFGGFDDRVLMRAARLGDGFITQFPPSENGKARIQRLLDAVRANGRNVEEFGLEAQVSFERGPELWGKDADAWKALGATFVCIRTMDAGLAGPADHINALEHYAREVGVTR